MSKAAELAALIGSQSALSNRNLIINGAMQVAQRGTSHAALSGYGLDRFKASSSSDGAVTVTQSTTVPSGEGFKNSMKFDVTTADTSLSASQYYQFFQPIEGQNFAYLMFGTSDAKSVTLSFWCRSNKTGTYVTTFMNSAANRFNPNNFTINSANTWEKKTITVTGDQSGTWLTTNGIGIYVIWNLALGSDFDDGTNGTWGSGDYGSGGNVNFLDSTSNELYITGVQMEVGEQATPFEHRSFDDEWHICQRFCTVYNVGGGNTHPQNLVSPNHTVPGAAGHVDVGNRAEWFMSYPVKRSQPTITVTDPTNMRWLASGNVVQDATGSVSFPVGTGHQNANVFQNVASGIATSNVPEGWLYKGSGTNPVITIDAEL